MWQAEQRPLSFLMNWTAVQINLNVKFTPQHTVRITELTAADDPFDGISKTGHVANRRHNEEILVDWVGGDGLQKLTVNERTHANRHDPDTHLSGCPRLRQRGRPVSRRGFGYEDDCQLQDRRILSGTVWCGENFGPNSGKCWCQIGSITAITDITDSCQQISCSCVVV